MLFFQQEIFVPALFSFPANSFPIIPYFDAFRKSFLTFLHFAAVFCLEILIKLLTVGADSYFCSAYPVEPFGKCGTYDAEAVFDAVLCISDVIAVPVFE